jgi:transposase InsO family protein
VCYGVSERRVCGVLGMCRSTCRYQRVADEQAALRMRLRDLAYSRASYGYRRLHILLAREGWVVNHKRVYRIYKNEGLIDAPKKPRRHVIACRRIARMAAMGPNDCWSMDFISDELCREQLIPAIRQLVLDRRGAPRGSSVRWHRKEPNSLVLDGSMTTEIGGRALPRVGLCARSYVFQCCSNPTAANK